MAEKENGTERTRASSEPRMMGEAARKQGAAPGPRADPSAEGEKGFRPMIERLPIGIYRSSPDGVVLLANHALLHMLGARSVAELAQRNPGGRPFETDYKMEWLQERLASEGEVRGLESAWTVDGAAIKVRENIHAMRDGNGRLVFYEGTVEDISERKNAEESLRAKADFLEEVVTNATVGIFVIDEDNKYVLINPECGRIVGHWPDDWTGREAGLHVHPEDQGKAMAHFIQAISGEQNDFEVRLESSDGTYKHCRINLSPMKLGEVAHVLGVVSDITEKANAEELLTEKRSQNLNIILVAALTHMAAKMPPGELEQSMGQFEKWFEGRFEKIFEEDMELISTFEPPGEKGMEGPELVVRRYMRFYSSLLKVFGVRTECTYGPTNSNLEILNCSWMPEAGQSPVPCRICKTILCGSFKWTGLEGSAEQLGTIAHGSSTCKFVFKPGPPRRRKADGAQ